MAKYLSGDDRAKALYHMWNIQYAIHTPESLKLAASYRRKLNREYPKWQWHQPRFAVPPRTAKLYNMTVIAREKIGESATLERMKFDYAIGKSAELLIISIPFSNKRDYLTALGKPATYKKPQVASNLAFRLSILCYPNKIYIKEQQRDGVYFGFGFSYGLPRPPSSCGGGLPSHYLGVALTPDKDLFFFILDLTKTPKELPSFYEFTNMLRRRYPLEGLIFLIRRTKFHDTIEHGFVDLARQLLAEHSNGTSQSPKNVK